jgi:hypothetical protein
MVFHATPGGATKPWERFHFSQENTFYISSIDAERHYRRNFEESQGIATKYVLTVIAMPPNFRRVAARDFSCIENPPHRAGALC